MKALQRGRSVDDLERLLDRLQETPAHPPRHEPAASPSDDGAVWYPVVVMALLCPLGAGIGSVVLLWLGVVDRVALGSAFAGSFVGLGSIVVVSWFMWLFGRGEDSDEDPLDDADTTDFVALSVLLGPSGLALVATVLIGLNAGG